ncbi:unnamed protein product [Prorocentrum cordatum]|uniref:Uncharacterized protein n=1 Tax=Prorocentrum cordatum TaxID=2364126 RepID=A0ABN9T8H7_9DINO|nr:unnamed protein product [Polarella glacialis]
MDDQELICSAKTVLVVSNSVLAANLSGSLEAIGIPHSAADKAVGRRKVRTEVNGTPPGLARQLRRRAGHAVGGAARGRCLTSVLAATVGLHDPFIALRVQLVASWCSLWFSDVSLHGRIRRAWPRVLGALRRAGKWRWRRAQGPVGALQATLLDMGWDPRAASVWVRPAAEGVDEGRLAGAADDSFHTCADFSGVLQDVEEDRRRQLWQSAASHLHGDDLVGGADFLHIGRELSKLEREARHAEWGTTLTVFSGGQRTRSRRADAGYALEQEGCARRGCAVETLVHRIWQCPANVGEEFESSAALVPRALAGHKASPAMWLRGVPASSLTTPVFCDLRAEQAAVSLGTGGTLEATRREDGFVVVYGDGSGEKYSDDPRRRRCATSIGAMGRERRGAVDRVAL